mmetsp:Transcript_128091/g.409524  ORF Transcript_128091/g.409524 Transcript_128091/m.409524 type:complete len:205 (+) Transcript_128091:560-1174(+)
MKCHNLLRCKTPQVRSSESELGLTSDARAATGCCRRCANCRKFCVLSPTLDVVSEAVRLHGLGGRDVDGGDELLRSAARHPILDDIARSLLHLDLDVTKPSFFQHVPHLILSRSPRNSASIALCSAQGFRNLSSSHDVRNRYPPTRPENPVHLAINLRLLRRQIDDAVGNHDICDPVSDGQVLDLPEPEGYIGDAILLGSGPGL